MMYFSEENGKLIVREAGEMVQIEAWGTDALRVRATKNYALSGRDQGLLPVASVGVAVIEEKKATYTNGRVSVLVESGKRLTFYRDGEKILREYANPYAPAVRIAARDYKPVGGNDYAIKARFESNAGEKLFGMGQYQQPDLELKGSVMELAPKNAQISIPFYISNLGYGFLWNNPAIGEVSFGKNLTEWTANRSEEIDYWITVGDTPKDLLKNYTEVTGRAPEFPENLMGLWQCKLRYRTQEEVLEVAREYHRRGLPLDCIVIDYYHWCHDGDWSFDPEFWPDPTAMVKELKSMGTRCMVSVWPTVENGSVNYSEINNKGLLAYAMRGEGGGIFGKAFYDATNSEARKLIWTKVKENYYDHGVDMYWLDCSEPEYLPADFDHYRYSVGPAEKTAGLYPLSHVQAFYEGQMAAGQPDIANLSRCAWVGAQRYAAVLWSGDIKSNFETLRAQVCAGLNIGMAGIPWWTTDTAGFIGNVEDPTYNELLIRWFQFSTFSPVLRLHGYLGPYGKFPRLANHRNSGGFVHTAQPHELWSHGEEVYEILKKYLFIRVDMKDYIKSLTEEASANGSPLLRAMFYEFPKDEKCWDLQDQYMFGGRYLVAPVMYEGMRERNVYLPEGKWKDIHTGEIVEGGQTILAAAPLEIIPVYEKL